jgi:energy-coupling factor transport system ATP-binding protein
MTAIEVRGLTHVYPDGTRALDGVDLVVPAGQRLAIVGQIGSGKTTLVRHLDGLLRPSAGSVRLDGVDIRSTHVARLARQVGLVFQDPGAQIFSSRVRAEVAFGPRSIGLRGGELDAAVDAALEAVGLADAGALNPYDLGDSRRRLLAVASVLAMRTPVVVLDEPTTGQDARGTAKIRRIVADLAAEGRTVIAISHDLRFVAETFERVVVIREGRVILDGSPEAVLAEPSWPTLALTSLEPPFASRVGARLGLGSTPTEAGLVDALASSVGAAR